MASRSHFDASDALHEFACFPCSEDGKNTEALYHCKICQTFYCQRCVAVHNKFTKNHNVTDKNSDTFGQKLGKTVTQFSNDLPTDVCEEHHGEVVKMFCGHHDLVCCTVCIAVNHRSCEGVEYIPNIAGGFLKSQGKEDIRTSLQSLKADLETLKSKVENDFKRVEKQRNGIIDDIQEFKKQIIAKVEELERKSLNEVKSKHKELADNISMYNKKIDGLLKVIDKRLHKFVYSEKDNEAQMFVDVKNGAKELSEGIDLVKQNSSKEAKPMAFKINTDIIDYLSKEQSFGSLNECTCVSIVCPFQTQITKAFESELQTQLKRYGISSKCIEHTKLVADRYTIVLFQNGRNNEDETIEKIKGIDDNMIILMNVRHVQGLSLRPRHGRRLKARFIVHYTDKSSSLFETRNNQMIYESLSSVVNSL